MILEVKEGKTFYSQVNVPAKKWLVQEEMDCPATTDKNGNTMFLKLNPILIYRDFYSSEPHEVFKSQTGYEVITDGTIQIEQLYEIFWNAMDKMIIAFNAIEQNSGNQPNLRLHPIPIENLLAILQQIVDWFEGD